MADEGKSDWSPTDDELMKLFGEGSAEGKAFIEKLGAGSRWCETTAMAGACKTADGKTGTRYKIVCVSSDGVKTTDYYCSAI